ncbi:putative transcriptional regulator [Salipiger mucosus DSM 16094]|uniref:Putative transcriptional regulator n=2 Tax=Salipiger mucosus TaxID=263378 RepID=S9S521_9RHOB|nr:putative transcriptional regulator [Salipiger mucosus DSM 16094]
MQQKAVSGFLRQALSGFLKENPRIVPSVRMLESDRVRQMVIENEADFGPTFCPRPVPGVTVLRELPFRVLALVPDAALALRAASLPKLTLAPISANDNSAALASVLARRHFEPFVDEVRGRAG